MNLYIDYSEFELTCWVANGRGYYDASGKFHYHHVPNDEW